MSTYCHVSQCHDHATNQCFECGLWHCDAHLAHVQIPTATGSFAEWLCPNCLETHFDTPDRYGFLTIDGLDPVFDLDAR